MANPLSERWSFDECKHDFLIQKLSSRRVVYPPHFPLSGNQNILFNYQLHLFFRREHFRFSDLHTLRRMVNLDIFKADGQAEEELNLFNYERFDTMPEDILLLLPVLIGNYLGVQFQEEEIPKTDTADHSLSPVTESSLHPIPQKEKASWWPGLWGERAVASSSFLLFGSAGFRHLSPASLVLPLRTNGANPLVNTGENRILEITMTTRSVKYALRQLSDTVRDDHLSYVLRVAVTKAAD